MILSNKILNKIMNSDYVKNMYPMIEKIDAIVDWDGDDEFPFYVLHFNVHLNDPNINEFNMIERGLNPAILFLDATQLLKMIGVNRNNSTIEQVYTKVFSKDGELLQPYSKGPYS
jgi:hypothetical protein